VARTMGGMGPRLTTVMKVEQKRANKLLGPETADDRVRNKEDPGRQLLEQPVSPSINRRHSGWMREKGQKCFEDIGTGFASKETLRMATRGRAIGIATSERASGTQCHASFFRLARASSGRCSWASLGVVLFESNSSEKGH